MDFCIANGIPETGIFKLNRIKVENIRSAEPMKPSAVQRGAFDFSNDGRIHVVRWKDSKVVSVASTKYTHLPIGTTTRYLKRSDKSTATNVNIDMPHSLKMYNNGMGSVDLFDKFLGSYRPTIKSRKWYFNLVTNAFNIAVVASYKLYMALHSRPPGKATNCKPPPFSDHLKFRTDLIQDLAVFGVELKDKVAASLNKKKPVITSHMPTKKDGGKRSKCRQCKKHTRFECKGCNLTICDKCFESCHIKVDPN